MTELKIKYKDYAIEIRLLVPFEEGEDPPTREEVIMFFKETINDYETDDFTIIEIP